VQCKKDGEQRVDRGGVAENVPRQTLRSEGTLYSGAGGGKPYRRYELAKRWKRKWVPARAGIRRTATFRERGEGALIYFRPASDEGDIEQERGKRLKALDKTAPAQARPARVRDGGEVLEEQGSDKA